jgi:hypothetical protein
MTATRGRGRAPLAPPWFLRPMGDGICPPARRSNLSLTRRYPQGSRLSYPEADMVWRLMWQVRMWFTPPRALNRYHAVAAALAAH